LSKAGDRPPRPGVEFAGRPGFKSFRPRPDLPSDPLQAAPGVPGNKAARPWFGSLPYLGPDAQGYRRLSSQYLVNHGLRSRLGINTPGQFGLRQDFFHRDEPSTTNGPASRFQERVEGNEDLAGLSVRRTRETHGRDTRRPQLRRLQMTLWAGPWRSGPEGVSPSGSDKSLRRLELGGGRWRACRTGGGPAAGAFNDGRSATPVMARECSRRLRRCSTPVRSAGPAR